MGETKDGGISLDEEETAHLERAPLAINPDGWARRAVVVVRAVRSARTPQTTSASLVGEGAPFASRTICGTGSSVLGAGAAVARVPLLVGGEDLAFSHITPCAKDTVRIANRALSASLAHRSVVYDAGDGVETARLARRGARRTRKRTETARVALRQLRRDGFTVSTTWTRHADMVDVAVGTFERREERLEESSKELSYKREEENLPASHSTTALTLIIVENGGDALVPSVMMIGRSVPEAAHI